jgi:hypothetical protein
MKELRAKEEILQAFSIYCLVRVRGSFHGHLAS